MRMDIGERVQLYLVPAVIGSQLGMQYRGVWLQSRLAIEHGRKLFVLDLDLSERLFRCVRVLRRDGGYAVADEPHSVPGEEGEITHAVADEHRR
jgi:hypothetical protein